MIRLPSLNEFGIRSFRNGPNCLRLIVMDPTLPMMTMKAGSEDAVAYCAPASRASSLGRNISRVRDPRPIAIYNSMSPNLKENQTLTWKQIAEFFPERSSGTLQVRHCTKLEVKIPQWTDETVSLNPPRLFERVPDILATSKSFGRPPRLRTGEVAYYSAKIAGTKQWN